MAGNIVLVRHGESRWNLDNRFTGWVDVPLSLNGIKEAERCAKHCKKFDFSVAFTSALERAHGTLHLILTQQGRTSVVQHPEDKRYGGWIRASNVFGSNDIAVYEHKYLNERYYGDLQGLNKEMAEKRYGKDQLLAWRRGYSSRPPGGGESLHDVLLRTRPYIQTKVIPHLKRGETVILVAHGNTLRSIIKMFEHISDENIAYVDLPDARPLVYSYKRGHFERTEGEYTFDRPLR